MKNHLFHSRKYFAAFLYLLFFDVCLLTFSIQTIALTRSAQRERRVQIFFAYNPTRPAAGQEVQFMDFSRGNPTSWLWDFGDGATSILQNPLHIYVEPGSYRVSLTARNNSSSGKVSRTLNVILSSSASFTYSPSYPVTGQAVQFIDTSAGGPTSWLWNFGDGSTSNSQNPSHSYATAASYTVSLTVVYSSGSKSVSQTITVLPPSALSASFTYSPSSPVTGQAIQFTDTSTGNPTSWLWNFGDNATSTSKNPSHTYTTAASYTVTLTVTNNTTSKTVSQTIIVLSASTLNASFTYSPSSPVAGQVVYFTDTSTGSPTSWQWNLGDGETSATRNPSHAYTTAASYTVTLTVANSSSSKSTSQTLTVLSAFAASFTYSPSSPAANQPVQFTDTSTGSPTSWQWNFGDSATSSVRNPSHTYAAAGQFWVNLIITKGADSQSTSQMITVRQPGVITAASPSYADVKAAVDSAVSGDTVKVPAGTATWSTRLYITKGIYLIGAGIGNTTITSGYNAPDDYLITFEPTNPASNEAFRLSGFTILGGNNNGVLALYNNDVLHPLTKVRIDHNYISRTGSGRVILVGGSVYGVIDSNEIHCVYYAVSIYGLQENNWLYTTFTPGTADNVFVEDNVIYAYDGIHATGQGGRYCIRYNTYHFLSGKGGCHPWFDAHGNQTAQNMGTMGVEIYENTLDMPGGESCTLVDHRGGEAIIFNNTVTTKGAVGFQIREEYNDNIVTPSKAPDGEPQYVSDSYYWNNRHNTTLIVPPDMYESETIDYGGSIGVVPRENIHFRRQVTSFNGSVGIGVGLLANRPASGLTVGVAYWATDTKTLYRATGANTWTAYYTPYAYPHPLRQAP